MLHYGLQEMNGAKLYLPASPDLRPGPDFVAARYARFRETI